MSFHSPSFEVADVEVAGELAFRYRQQGAELPRHRGAHQRRGEILQRLVALQQVGQAGEVVVVAVGVEDARHFLLADAERIEAVVDVRPGIDQVDPALVDQHAAHRRTVVVPAVAVAGMHHGEVMAIDGDMAQRIGAGIGFVRRRLRSTSTQSSPWRISNTLFARRLMLTPSPMSIGSRWSAAGNRRRPRAAKSGRRRT
jgi:hypothetical protein